MKTMGNFMQTMGQVLTANTQAIAQLEMLLGQLATTISKREKEKLPSQLESNPRAQISQQQSEGWFNHINAIHTLRSERQVNNHMGMSEDQEDLLSEPPHEQLTHQTKSNGVRINKDWWATQATRRTYLKVQASQDINHQSYSSFS